MVKYITPGMYSFLNECILYIIILHLQQSLMKHMPLLRIVRRIVVGSTVLVFCSLCM
jgi:hypothetical protein